MLLNLGVWDRGRERLRDDLGSQDVVCGDLYRRAIDTMGSEPLTVVDLMIAAQAMRELVNRFPRVTGTLDLPGGRSTREDVQRFVETWEIHVEATAGQGDMGLSGMPEPVLAAARELVANFRDGNASSWRLRSALVRGRTDADGDPTVKEVARAIADFERVRHPQGDTTGWLDTETPRILAGIEVVENALEARLGSFFGVADQLKEVLGRANASSTGPDGVEVWSSPDERDLRDVVSRLADVQHRRVFFGALRNPLWLDPLAARGLFASAPAQQFDADDRRVWVLWPEGEYLAAVAADRPARVATILKGAVGPRSARDVRIQLVSAALAMPAEQAATLVSTLVPFVELGMDYPFEQGLVELIEKLAGDGRLRKARSLAWKLLRPLPGAERLFGVEIESAIGRHWYADAMERVLLALRSEATLLSWLVNRLADAERIAWGDLPSAGHDLGYVWRPAIGVSSAGHDRDDVRHVLVDAVREVAMDRLADGWPAERVVWTIEATGVPILTRISLYILARHTETSKPADPAVLQLALERLVDAGLVQSDVVRSEYLLLAGAVLPQLSDADFGLWRSAFAACPQISPRHREAIAQHLAEGQTLEEVLADEVEERRHYLLAAIGESALRGDALAELADLDSRRGQLELSDELAVAHWSYVDYPSPFSADELGAMSATEVIEILRAWEPASEDRSQPNKDGLSREFRATVRQHTMDYSRVAAQALTLPHLYASRYLDGLREGVNDHGGQLDWDPLLSALFSLPSRSDQLRPDDGPHIHGWDYPLRQALALLDLGTRQGRSPVPPSLLPKAAEFAARYLADPDPSFDLSRGLDLTSESGPLQRSLSTVRPQAVRTIVKLALYEHEHPDAAARPGPVTTLTTELLSRLLVPGRDGSSAVAAALGEAYARILIFAPDWIEQHQSQLLSADTFGEIVVTTALACCHPSLPLVESLAPALADLISQASHGRPVADGWKTDRTPLERIGDHLMVIYLRGSYELDAPLIGQFFHETPVDIRRSVLGHVGWLFLGDADIPDDVLLRARRLWESRAAKVTEGSVAPAELGDFHWWVHCGKFPTEWWLPLLRQAAEATELDGRLYLGEHLAEAARLNTHATIDILSRLLHSTPQPMVRYNLIENAPVIIARGLESNDTDTAQEAQQLMDWLGKNGNLEIKDHVDQARQDG